MKDHVMMLMMQTIATAHQQKAVHSRNETTANLLDLEKTRSVSHSQDQNSIHVQMSKTRHSTHGGDIIQWNQESQCQ